MMKAEFALFIVFVVPCAFVASMIIAACYSPPQQASTDLSTMEQQDWRRCMGQQLQGSSEPRTDDEYNNGIAVCGEHP